MRHDVLGWAGAVLGLAGYVVVERVAMSDAPYVASSALLGADAARRRAWSFLAINAVWGLISVVRLAVMA